MQLIQFIVITLSLHQVNAWVVPSKISVRTSNEAGTSTSLAIAIGKNYEPKWKKKQTLADKQGAAAPKDVGLAGQVSVVFKQGDNTIRTVASPGDPIRDIASQSGQFIKYGCGKGECGTCKALCNGKYITPCTDVIPADIGVGQDYVIQVKAVKSKGRSSGKFYSARSFVMGFYNNLLGMFGFVRDRRLARKNLDERLDYEDMIARKTAERKAAREAAAKLNQ